MKYDLVISEDIAKDVYSLHAFDSEWSGQERTLDRVILYLHEQATDRAMAVCNNISDAEGKKPFDRGYVKGIYETMMFLKKASTTGRLLQFPDEKHSETPAKIV
jgi:hypothetical protein